jgi:hypothetical protein
VPYDGESAWVLESGRGTNCTTGPTCVLSFRCDSPTTSWEDSGELPAVACGEFEIEEELACL